MGRSVSSAQAVLTGLLPPGPGTSPSDQHVIRLNRGPQWMVYSEAFVFFIFRDLIPFSTRPSFPTFFCSD